jgi:hypothetical protein
MPLVSEPDGLSAPEGIGDRLLRNLRAEVTLLREHDVDIEAFPGAGRVWAHEQHTIGPDGEGVARMLAAACGPYVIVVSASGSPEWAWDSHRRRSALTRQIFGRIVQTAPSRTTSSGTY